MNAAAAQAGLGDDSAGWYRCSVEIPRGSGSCAVRIEGAATLAEVWVNGIRIGSHRGAYTAAEFDLGNALKPGEANQIALRVSNREADSQDCLSRSNLYYTPGGLYRPVSLILTGQSRFSAEFGSSGVYLTPAEVSDKQAILQIDAVVHHGGSAEAEINVRHRVLDSLGAQVLEFGSSMKVPANGDARFKSSELLTHPHLWALRAPQLYSVESSLYVNGQLSDRITQRTGFRRIELRGGRFFLNGKEVLLRGVNKHHMSEWSWNALSQDELRAEWDGMDAMGVNTVRLAHYPHSTFEYDQADERGLAVWAENGLAGQSWKQLAHEETTVTPDGERITRELVRQNWNHPSILIWSSGNETIVDVAAHYAEVIRSEDHSRLVTFAANADKPRGCDFDAYNTYDGWYGGHYAGYADIPRNAYVSETGAGSWSSHHVPYGTISYKVDSFEPEEYQEMFTEYRLQLACHDDAQRRPMLLWWNYREFYNKKFKNNRNSKGIVTLAGQPKDIWYLFQAFLATDRPVLHLAGSNHFLRSFAPDNGLKAYGNAKSAELFVNGVSAGLRLNGDYCLPDSLRRTSQKTDETVPGIHIANVFFWNASLKPGKNVVEVRDALGGNASMIVYQKNSDGSVPSDPEGAIASLTSSNPANPAVLINRAVRAQSPFYSAVDGTSDNTFDALPSCLEGASWISTLRTGVPANKTDLSFRAVRNVTIFLIHSTGTFPRLTLKTPDSAIEESAAALSSRLMATGFARRTEPLVWRDHLLNLADAALWSKSVAAGETVNIPGEAVDSLTLVKEP